ncbi:MAG: hypothetical protein OEY51_07150 [Cyclobacteriaceae bacterium]|nr:hypothetical protein [Cyclobacteriaceae bacterium]
MANKYSGLDIIIDKLTRSIENVVTGDSLPTEVSSIQTSDLRISSKKNGWLFDWKKEFAQKERDIYKLTIVNNSHIIQGLVSLEVKEDHVFVHLVENAPFNRGVRKMYMGVAGNLMAFACKLSFQRGHEGNIAFISKTQLIDHYVKTLGAVHFGGRLMIIETKAAVRLIDKYFHNG